MSQSSILEHIQKQNSDEIKEFVEKQKEKQKERPTLDQIKKMRRLAEERNGKL